MNEASSNGLYNEPSQIEHFYNQCYFERSLPSGINYSACNVQWYTSMYTGGEHKKVKMAFFPIFAI